MKYLKKSIAMLISALIAISSLPIEALAYNQDDFDWYGDYEYVDTINLDGSESVSGSNEYCTWSYDAETSTVYIDGEIIESSQNAYADTEYDKDTGMVTCQLNNARLPLYTEVDDNGVTREQYCTDDFEHLVIGKNTKSFKSHISDMYYKNLKDITFEEGCELTEIGKGAFYRCAAESITLPDTVSSIGESAFELSNIKEFVVPTSVTVIPKNMFYKSKLEKIQIPSGVEKISERAFAKTNISEIDIPETVTSIGAYAAQDTKISQAVFPSSFKYVPEGFFCNCKNVTSIDFLSSAFTGLRNACFSGCSITDLDFSKTNITYIGDYAFGGCESLKTVVLNKNTTYLSGFNNCPNLEHVEFTDKVTAIGQSAFKDDENTTFSAIPDSVYQVYSMAFQNSGITQAVFNTTNDSPGISTYAFAKCKKLSSVALPERLNTIASGTFLDCSLKSITVPDAVTTVGDYAFEGSLIESVKIGKNSSLKYIRETAFANCVNLTSFTIPKNAWTVYKNAFCGDINLKTVIVNSPNVNFNENPFSLSKGDETACCISKIYGHEDSSAKYFAEKMGIEFALISDMTDYPDSDEDYASTNKGTWENGTWVYDENTERLLIKGSGVLSSTFKNANGTEISIVNYLSGKELNNIVICEGITGVADDVFYSENGVDTVNISLPSTLTSIGSSAFRNIKATGIRVNGSLDYIGSNAFYGSGITKIDLSKSVLTEIEKYAFANCKSLTTVILPNTVKEIREGAFYSSGLTKIQLPESVVNLGKKAFSNCLSLVKITIENNGITIYADSQNKADNAFGYDDSGMLIKNDVAYSPSNYAIVNQAVMVDADLSSTAFEYAENNNLVVFSENQKADKSGYIQESIPAKWYYFEDTKTMYIEGVFNLAKYKFHMYENNYIMLGGDGSFTNEDGSPIDDLDVDLLYICSGVQIANACFEQVNPKYIHFADTVTEIGGSAFKNCDRLTVLSVPDTITKVGISAFEGCRSLVKIALSNSMTYISNSCFKNCTSLKEIDYGSVTSIEDKAFYSCSGLEEIDIPSQIVRVGSKAFYDCVGVKKITVSGGNDYMGSKVFYNMPFCTTLVLNTNYDEASSTARWSDTFYHLGFSTTGIDLVVGDDVTIPDFSGLKNTFSDSKTKITSIHFGKNVSDFYTLPDMKYIEKLTVSEVNKHMYAYEGNIYYDKTLVLANPNIHKVIIKDGTTVIGSGAFKDSCAMQIALPDSVTEIQEYAFYNMKNLKRVVLNSNLKKVGDSAFEGCVSLYSVEFPSLVNTIGSHCFDGCVRLQSVILPNWITKIEPYTFYGCSSLRNIVVPKLVNTIGEYAFSSCQSLENIFIWRTVTTLGANWLGAFYPNVTIHTLTGSKAYQYAAEKGIKYTLYTSTVAFGEVCDAQLEEDGEFVDICQDGHGEIEYLTVYDADCENDGYIIGVCEYCSEVLEEIHTTATGHNYCLVADIAPTDVTKGVKQYTCKACGNSYCEYTDPLSEEAKIDTFTVSGKLVVDSNQSKSKSQQAPLRRANIVIDGVTVATTDDDGNFSMQLETGAYTANIEYAYGFTRTIGIVVEDCDIAYETPIAIVGVDYNRDGIVNDDDLEMFSIVMSSSKDDTRYLDYCDLNNDGYINAKDYIIIRSFIGISADTYEYSVLTISK